MYESRTDDPGYHDLPSADIIPINTNLNDNVGDKAIDDFYEKITLEPDLEEAEELMNSIFCHSEELYHGVMQLLVEHACSERQLGQDAKFYKIVNEAIAKYIKD